MIVYCELVLRMLHITCYTLHAQKCKAQKYNVVTMLFDMQGHSPPGGWILDHPCGSLQRGLLEEVRMYVHLYLCMCVVCVCVYLRTFVVYAYMKLSCTDTTSHVTHCHSCTKHCNVTSIKLPPNHIQSFSDQYSTNSGVEAPMQFCCYEHAF